jgi:riboflavin synthase
MFSGIIEHTAKILYKKDGLFRLENTFWSDIKIGQSIAHDGACMTLTHIDTDWYEFFMMEESLKKTHFEKKKIGDLINVERCIALGERLDGHIVTGHIDTVWVIKNLVKQADNSLIITCSYPEKFDHLIIEKGSIALNGTSLTVIQTTFGEFSVSLIPLTQDWTNLGKLSIGDLVNIEFDVIGKYIQKLGGFHQGICL